MLNARQERPAVWCGCLTRDVIDQFFFEYPSRLDIKGTMTWLFFLGVCDISGFRQQTSIFSGTLIWNSTKKYVKKWSETSLTKLIRIDKTKKDLLLIFYFIIKSKYLKNIIFFVKNWTRLKPTLFTRHPLVFDIWIIFKRL